MTNSPIAFAATSGGDSSRQLAQLEVRPPPKNREAKVGKATDVIQFQFNPKELKVSKSATWKRESQRNRKSSDVPEFSGSGPVKLTLEMFLDATEKMDDSVVKTVEKLFSLVVPTKDSLSAGKACPPVCTFRWGGLSGFVAFVSQVQVTYSLFTPNGTPVRATAQVSLEEFSPEHPPQNPTSGSERPQSTHQLVEGDTLHSLAYSQYGDAGRWREVAAMNGIDDPLRVAPGETVLLPAAEDLEVVATV